MNGGYQDSGVIMPSRHGARAAWRRRSMLPMVGVGLFLFGCDTIQDRNREAARRTSQENCVVQCERSFDVCGDSVYSELPSRDVNSGFGGGGAGYPVFGRAGSCRDRLDTCLERCRGVR